jgi:hypothetical protein
MRHVVIGSLQDPANKAFEQTRRRCAQDRGVRARSSTPTR